MLFVHDVLLEVVLMALEVALAEVMPSLLPAVHDLLCDKIIIVNCAEALLTLMHQSQNQSFVTLPCGGGNTKISQIS